MAPDLDAVFPELADVDDADLRKRVRRAWKRSCADNDVTDLEAIPWLPQTQRALGIEDATLVDHVRDVTAGALALADAVAPWADRDLLLAGALVHDVSKLYEFDGMDATPVADLLGHPYYGVHVVTAAGLPVELAHVVLAHTTRTTVEPAFLEAELVRRADQAAAAALRSTAVDDLRDARPERKA